ncbi:uncharacterized protein LOC133198696 [Saccostrea echinata]|uniref:uncharacterized protein LOC133198696 n=1 Tax=Saccostrea echinata TaxID=191078 RepID=UPI002A836A0E|nr:uncharacterized protein LOC133198696 [Saccostrea echinata]XP_061190706.1 uncharacterized protein LOC133198696 [Saccostrea echinata]
MACFVRYSALFGKFRIHTLKNKRHLHSRNENLQNTAFRNNLEHYLSEHEYSLAAVKIYGNHELEEEDEIVSEPFSETTFWRFGWYKLHEKAIDSGDLKTTLKILGARSSTIFAKGYDAIERYLRNKGELSNSHEEVAFAALQRFYSNKEYHESRLMKLRHKMSETHVASIISQHLLSQLLPYPSNYFLDSIHTKGKSDGCPCGCGELIHYGSTQLGSPHLFYGFVDVVLIPTNRNLFMGTSYNKSAVFTVKKTTDEIYGHRLINKDWMKSCDFNDDIAAGEYKSETKLLDEKQLCKQAISVSLCQYRKYLECSKMGNVSYVPMVPVCAISNDSYEVAVYDPEHDFLLKCNKPLNLFDDDLQFLKFSTIVDLWLMIHHSLFCSQPGQHVIQQLKGTANLIPQLGKKRFDKIVKNSSLMYLPQLRQKSISQVSEKIIKFADEEEKEYVFDDSHQKSSKE